MPALGFSQIGGLNVFAFQPSQLDIFAQPVPGGFAPIAPADIIGMSGAVAALNGPEFLNCDGQNLPNGNASYAVSQCGYPQFLVQGSSISSPGTRPGAGMLVSVNGNSVSFDGSGPVTVQLWPPLIVNGQVVASNSGSNATSENRAALAVFQNPNLLAFVTGQGSMVDFANAIAQLGATAAGYTDGGGSAALAPYSGGSRPVPVWLIARPPGGGGSALLGALIVAGIVGGILYATAKRPRANPRRNPRQKTIVPGDVILELPNGGKILIAAMYALKSTGRKFDFYAMYLPPHANGPGTGREGGYIDKNGRKVHDPFLFDTQGEAADAAQKFISVRPNPNRATRDLNLRSTADAIRYVENQSEPAGWPGDVEIATIPSGSTRSIRTEKDRSVYPIKRIGISTLRTTQPVVDRQHTIRLLREGWQDPILVSSTGEILDGHHRAYAASLRGDRTILARIVAV